jgi:putative DNA primase/helicase
MPRTARPSDADSWRAITPVPGYAPAAAFKHYHYTDADRDHVACYRIDRQLYGYVVRFRTSSGGKEVQPYTWCESTRDGGQAWRWKAWEEPRPLYVPAGMLPPLAARIPVILVEGEKKAEILHLVLELWAPGKYLVVTWPGGCGAWKKADWAWLHGCSVLLWPDADAKREQLTVAERKQFGADDGAARDALAATKPFKPESKQPGMAAMLGIGALLASEQACSVALLPIPKPGMVASGWDCADAISEGWDFGRLEAFFRSAAPLVLPPAEKPAKNDSGKPLELNAPPDDGTVVPLTISEDAFALAFLANHQDHIYVAPWRKWMCWDGKRWREDATALVYQRIRDLIRATTGGTRAEVKTANAACVSGVERLARTDQRIVKLPEQLDADPWALNTQSGIVDMRTGQIKPHDKAAMCTRITRAAVRPEQGAALWAGFLADVTQGDAELAAYLQRVAGYCALGVTSEDLLVYLFGIGSNGKSSFAEAIAHALGDYAKVFSPEVLMESKGERHPTDLAQFMGVRFALTSEPGAHVTWNDARVKSLTGDSEISARFMRGDFFTFPRTHKMVVLGNHMPRMKDVSHAMRRRLQMVPFRAVFDIEPGPLMRNRLKSEASGAVLAWVIEGAQYWQDMHTAPPLVVTDMTTEYFSDQDLMGQWLAENCERRAGAFELLSTLHKNYKGWCEVQGVSAWSNLALSQHLRSAGFEKRHTMAGKVFHGLELKSG